MTVNKADADKTLNEMERTQTELRQSIEDVKRLAEKSQQLLDRHRKEMKDE